MAVRWVEWSVVALVKVAVELKADLMVAWKAAMKEDFLVDGLVVYLVLVLAVSWVDVKASQKVVWMAVELVVMWVGEMETLMAGHLDTTTAYMTVE